MPKDDNIHRRQVRRRRVLYLHGFDPASSERYRRLLARAGAERAGAPPVISPVAPLSNISDGWRVNTDFEGVKTETVFEVLRYEDIVRSWRNRALPVRLFTGLVSWVGFVASGGLARAFKLAKGPAGLFFYPVMMLALFIGLGVFGGRMVGEGAEWLGAPDWASQLGRLIGAGLGLWASVRLERSFFAHLMLALYDFLFRMAGEKDPHSEMEVKIGRFAKRIADCVTAAERENVDEILIVGHSLGGYVALKSLASALRHDIDLTGGAAKVSLLTLGSVAGYVSCRGGDGAAAFDADVGLVASDEDLVWIDVSSPRDWFSFGLVDPLLMVQEPPVEARSPRVISAKFGKAEPDPADPRTRFRAMSLHMKYLAAPDRAGGFDFFLTACGPKTLADTFEGRRNSPKARMLAN